MKRTIVGLILWTLISGNGSAQPFQRTQLDQTALFELGPNDPSLVLYSEVRCAALFSNTYDIMLLSPGRAGEASLDNSKVERFLTLIDVHPLRAKLGEDLTPELSDLKKMYFDRWKVHAKQDGNYFDQITISDFKVCNYLVDQKYPELYNYGFSVNR